MKLQLGFYFIGLLVTILSCNQDKRHIDQKSLVKEFSVVVKSIQGDTIVTSALYKSGYIFCLRHDNRIFVLDTLLNSVDSLTLRFLDFQCKSLVSIQDTVFLLTNKGEYFLGEGLKVIKYNGSSFQHHVPIYSDSEYAVTSCCSGEWGGYIFFKSKRNSHLYAHHATCVQQVLKFDGNYIIANYLHHGPGTSNFISIDDPSKLFAVMRSDTQAICRPLYTGASGTNVRYLRDTNTHNAVEYICESGILRVLSTFVQNGHLYSIYCTDSATLIARHENYSLILVDTLLNRPIDFSESKTQNFDGITVTAYWSRGATSDLNNNIIEFQNSGLIYIKNKEIMFVDFNIPYQRKKE